MATRTFQIALPPEQEHFIDEALASGRFLTPTEMIAEGLELLRQREAARQAAIAAFRREIAEGAAEADRGELIDGDVVFAELERHSELRRKGA